MRNEIKAIKARHDRDHEAFFVDDANADPNLSDFDDVSYQQWLFVHRDRAALLAEIHRLYSLLRRRRHS